MQDEAFEAMFDIEPGREYDRTYYGQRAGDSTPERVEHHDRDYPGKWLFVSMIVTAVIVVGLLIASVYDEISTRQEFCEAAVDYRHDTRAMWLAAFEVFPDSEGMQELRIVLDEKLPELTCPPSNDTNIPQELNTLPVSAG